MRAQAGTIIFLAVVLLFAVGSACFGFATVREGLDQGGGSQCKTKQCKDYTDCSGGYGYCDNCQDDSDISCCRTPSGTAGDGCNKSDSNTCTLPKDLGKNIIPGDPKSYTLKTTQDDGADPTKWTTGIDSTDILAQCNAAATYFGIIGGGVSNPRYNALQSTESGQKSGQDGWGCGPETWRDKNNQQTWWRKNCYDPQFRGLKAPTLDPDKYPNLVRKGCAGENETASVKGCQAGTSLGKNGSCTVKCSKDSTPDNGTDTYTCTDGQLSPATLKCTPNTCPLPTAFTGNVVGAGNKPCKAGGSINNGDSCEVGCDHGFIQVNGSKYYTCKDGVTTRASISCEPDECVVPGTLGTGIVGGDKNPCKPGTKLNGGETCEIKCDKGFKSSGGTTTYGCSNGIIETATLKCSPIACTVPDQFGPGIQGEGKNACLNGAPLKGDTSCGVGCRSGYKPVGGTTSYDCSSTGELSDASLKCQRIACPLPSRFGKGRTWGGDSPCEEGGELLSGGKCTIKCASGYHTGGGSPTYTCDKNGTLQEADLKCTPNTCTLPQKFGAGRISGGDTPCQPGGILDAGGNCTIQCGPGYKPVSGSSDYSCDHKGNLKPSNLDCKAVSCTIPTDFGRGVSGQGAEPCIPGSQIQAGKSCSVGCAPSYELVGGQETLAGKEGTMEFHCSKTGFLTAPEIKCRQDQVLAYNAVWSVDLGNIRN